MLYNHRTSRKVPVVGKHNKAITCGAWSEANLLALGSEDRTLSISNVEGDTLRVATLRAEPSDVQFSEMKQVLYKLHLFWITHLTRWLGTISKSFELIFSSNNFTFWHTVFKEKSERHTWTISCNIIAWVWKFQFPDLFFREKQSRFSQKDT